MILIECVFLSTPHIHIHTQVIALRKRELEAYLHHIVANIPPLLRCVRAHMRVLYCKCSVGLCVGFGAWIDTGGGLRTM